MRKLRKIIAKILTIAILLTQITSAPYVFAEDNSSKNKENPKETVSVELSKPSEKTNIIVKYKNESTNLSTFNNVKGKLKLNYFNVKKSFENQRINVIEIDQKDNIDSVIEELNKDPNILYAQPDYPLSITESGHMAIFKQWGISNSGLEIRGKIGRQGVDINLMNALGLSSGENVVIGVLDSGIDIEHSNLKDNIYINQNEIPGNGIDDDGNGYIDDINGWNFADDISVVYKSLEEDIHGTHIAGVIAAGVIDEGLTGILGVAPNAKILPLKFISGTKGYTSNAIEAIEYAKTMGVKIINCSFGGTDNNIALKETMANSGMLFVCSAGNRGGDSNEFPVYPASFDLPNVISVASIDSMGILTNFSNRGNTVDVAAPGANIISTIPGQDYDYFSGTSLSAAFVSGIAALIQSYLPESSVIDIKNRIVNNVVKCDALKDVIASGGRVDAFAALTNTPPTEVDTYNGLGAGDDIVPVMGEGSSDTWYITDERASNIERFHYGEGGVNPASGNYSVTCVDMSVPAPGFQVNFSRTYNSKDEKPTLLGRGWTFGFEGKSSDSWYTVYINLPDGSTHVFHKEGDKYTPEGTRASYIRNSDKSGVLTTNDQYKYGFDSNGNMVWMEDRNGNKININYVNGKIDNIVDTVGRVYNLEYYSNNGLLKSITDPESRKIVYEYNDKNLLVKVTDPNNQSLRYEYDSAKYLTKLIDGNNNLFQTLEYDHNMGDSQNKICKTIDAAGETWLYSYDIKNKKTTISNSQNKQWTYGFNVSMYTTSIQDPEGRSEKIEYWFNNGVQYFGDIKSRTDRNGNKTLYEIDNNGNITSITNPDQITDPNNGKKRLFYDNKNNLIKEIDEVGNKTFLVYDSETKTQLLKRVQPLNGVDEFDNSNTDPTFKSKFAITEYEYYSKADAKQLFNCDVAGLLKKVTDSEGNTEVYTYDKYGNIKTYQNKSGSVTTYEYNKVGWKTKEISPNQEMISWDYDKNGQVIRRKNPDGGISRVVYDNAGYKIFEVAPEQYEPDKDNLQTNQYFGLIGTKYNWYDNGYLEYTEDVLGNRTRYTYDKFGNIVSELKPNNAYYRFEYDVLNRPTKIYFKDMNNQSSAEILLSETSYSILPNGNSQKTDTIFHDISGLSKSTTTTITDYANRIVEQQYPDLTRTKTIYNYDGTVKEKISKNGSSTIYKYDGMGRVSDVWSPASIVEGNIKYSWTSFKYNKNGNIIEKKVGKQLVGANGVTNDTYSVYSKYNKGQLIEQSDSDGKKTAFEYDLNGNVKKESKYVSPTETKVSQYQYDYAGRPIVVTDIVRKGDIFGSVYNDNSQESIITQYTYDKNGNILRIIQPNGAFVDNTYDKLDRLLSSSIIDKRSNKEKSVTTSKTYTWDGKVETSTDANGNITRYYYDIMGNMVKTVDAKNNISLAKYDLAGRKIAEVSPKNVQGTDINSMERTEYTYDLMNRLKTKAVIFKKWNLNKINFSWSEEWTRTVIAAYAYDNMGNVTKSLDGMGFNAGIGNTDNEKISTGYGTTNTYTLSGQLETTKDAETDFRNLPYSARYEYNGLGQKIKETYADNTVITYSYDGSGNLLSRYVNGKLKGSIKYDLLGRAIETTDGLGNTTLSKWNVFDKIAQVITPGDDTIPSSKNIFQYDKSGNLVYSKNNLGKENEYTYDFLNRQGSSAKCNEYSGEMILVLYDYDAYGNKISETNENGNITKYTYNELNQLVSSAITVGRIDKITSYTYDANGNRIRETDYLDNTTQYVYDGINRLVEIIDATGNIISQIEYNDANAQIRAYDALHNLTEYGYDKNLRQTYIIDGEGNISTQSYDNRGNVATKKDGKNNITSYGYDAENRLKNVINSFGETTTYTYDNNGNMLSQTDGNGNVTMFSYNAMNKLKTRIDPNGLNEDGRTESYNYYANGLIKSKIDRNGNITTYAYDVFDRLICENVAREEKHYTYDGNNNLLTMTDSTGTTTREYDEQNRVISKTVPVIGKTTYKYDVPSNIPGYVVEITRDPEGNTTEKTYDNVGRLYSVKNNNNTTTYTYFTNGNRESIIYPDGTREEYSYYKNNRVKTLDNIKSNGEVLQSYTYTYDAAGNQTSKTTISNSPSDGTTLYEYDSLNRLQSVTEANGKITIYSYDKAGNRKTETVKIGEQTILTSYTYNEQNRLITTQTRLSDNESEKTTYVYDNNGNLKTKTKTTMIINAPVDEQNLASFEIEIVRETDQGSGSEYLSIYSYDNFNRLISIKEGSTTSTYKYNAQDYRVEKTVNNTTTLYLYEADKVVLETDSTGRQKALNIYGTNLLYRSVNNEEYYYLYNAHGDVVALISPSGEIAGTYDYDAFGNIISQTGNVNNNITYAGYQYDEETDLYYLNARYYDSKIARFITEDSYRGSENDPLSLNLYTYCHNEPIMYTDPTGHTEELDSEIDGDTEFGAEALKIIAEATSTWNRLYSAFSGQKDKNSDYAKYLKNLMDNAHKRAEDARFNYAANSRDREYIDSKYGEGAFIIDVKKFTNNIESYDGLAENLIYAKDFLTGAGIARAVNEMQAWSESVGTLKYFYIGYDDAYFSGMEDFLEILESEYILPNVKNVEAYYEGKHFGNTASVASGIMRIMIGLKTIFESISLGSTGVALTISGGGAGALVGIPAIAVSIPGVIAGAAAIDSGYGLTQVAWDKVINEDNKGVGSKIPSTRAGVHQDLLNKGYRCNGTSEGGYVTYMHPDGRRVDIRPNGEVINTQKTWLPDGSRKITERYYYDGTKVPNGGHNTGEFVEPIGPDTFLPPKP